MLRSLLALALILASGCRPAGPAAPTLADPAARVLAEGRRILANVRRTTYSHRPVVDEAAGVYELDCSDLVALLLKSAAPEQLAAVRRACGRANPRAMDFENFLESVPPGGRDGWRRVERLADARAGDLLAWRHPKPVENNTGHVMLLLEDPSPERGGQGEGGGGAGRLWRLVVLDATSAPHGADTRPEGTGGVGRGTIWIRTDAAGRAEAYLWSSPRGRAYAEPMSVGRPSRR